MNIYSRNPQCQPWGRRICYADFPVQERKSQLSTTKKSRLRECWLSYSLSPLRRLSKRCEIFIQEEVDSEDTITPHINEKPTCPPIELKSLPSGLRYTFLNDDSMSPIIISDKLSNEETTKLIAIMKKHISVFGYC